MDNRNNLSDIIDIPAHVYEKLDSSALIPIHNHDSVELIYVIDGICHLKYMSRNANICEKPIMAGQFVLIAPNVNHLWTSGFIHYVVIEFNSILNNCGIIDYLQKKSAFAAQFDISEKMLEDFKDVYIFNDTQDIQYTLFRLLQNIKNKKTDSFDSIGYDLLLKNLYYLIMNCAIEDDSKKGGNIYVNKAYNFFEINYKNKLTLKMLSDFLKITPAHLERTFKAVFNSTAMKCLNAFRIAKAKNLLRSGDYSAVKLARLVGYQNIKSFNNNFKAVTGMTPAQYRATVVKNVHSTIVFSDKYQHRVFISDTY